METVTMRDAAFSLQQHSDWLNKQAQIERIENDTEDAEVEVATLAGMAIGFKQAADFLRSLQRSIDEHNDAEME